MQASEKRRALDESMGIDDDDEDTQANKYLCFRIGKESYGIGIKHLIEIIELQHMSVIPDLPDYVKGVINLRGKMIPIIDLRLRFKLEARGYDDRTCIVITEIDGVLIGFIVDTVEEVIEIPESQVSPAPKFKGQGEHDQYISGLGKVGEAVKILLDIEKVVQDQAVRELALDSEAVTK